MRLGALLSARAAVAVSAWCAAAGAAEPAPPAAPPAAPRCYPPCREGFVCHQGRCVSACNPPCPPGEVCIEGRRCELAPLYGPNEPLPPPVKPFESRSHGLIGFHLGFAGDVEQDDVEAELATTYGFNLRGDVPVERYLLLGALFQFGAWRPDLEPAPDRSYYIDIDFYLRGRIPIVTDSANFQVWAGVPVGLTLDILGDDVPAVSGLGVGWNIGVLAGGAVHFSPKFGLFAELGWLQHRISHDAEPGSDLDFRLAQWNLNLGFVFKN